jgi:hypothetical protein
MSREHWLRTLVLKLRPIFEAAGYPLPAVDVRVATSVLGAPVGGVLEFTHGFPTMVFISKRNGIASAVIPVVVRGLVRAAVGVQAPWEEYNALAKKLGIYDVTPQDKFAFLLGTIPADLGPYPEE